MKPVSILEFPTNLGLRAPSPGREPGVRRLPSWLKAHGFYEQVGPAQLYTLTPPPYAMDLDEASGVRNADAIAHYAREQAGLVRNVLDAGYFPLAIGGDCSILIGNALGLRKSGRYGLFFLDGHTDFAWPSMSRSKAAAGMDLAIVTGYAHPKLADIDDMKPYIQEGRVWCVGNREYDEVYEKAIRESRIHYTDLPSLRQTGVGHCVASFLWMVQEKDLDGFWVHIDLDVLDDALMPAVDSRTEGGLTYEELDEALRALLADPKAAGLEITVLDPDLDPDGRYTEAFVREFTRSFRSAIRDKNIF